MPNEQRVWGVLFTNAGLSELRDVLEPYLSTGSIGPYLYCKQVDMGNPYLRMIVDYRNPDGSTFETEMALVGFQGRGFADGVQPDFCHSLLLEALIFQQL
jgi:hypothetical protein